MRLTLLKAYRQVAAGLALALALGSCNGILGDIYDSAPDDGTVSGNFGEGSRRCTLTLDARSYTEWHYIDLHKQTIVTEKVPIDCISPQEGETTTDYREDGDGGGAERGAGDGGGDGGGADEEAGDGATEADAGWSYYLVEGDNYTLLRETHTLSQPEPDHWDLALHHYDAKTNGGAVWQTSYASIDELLREKPDLKAAEYTPDVWTTHQAIVDLEGMLAYHIGYQRTMCNLLLTGWVTMDISTPPPTFASTGSVYVLRCQDDTYAALQLLSYMSAKGTKGYLTIDVAYPL